MAAIQGLKTEGFTKRNPCARNGNNRPQFAGAYSITAANGYAGKYAISEWKAGLSE